MRARKTIHPLLLEPTYWRTRLSACEGVRPTVLTIPRADLSGGGKEVVEFRLKAHDGTRLWGLFARPTWRPAPWPARIRAVDPAHRPQFDASAVAEGTAELVYQEPAGRKLEDRVLDAVRVWQMAMSTEGIRPDALSFDCPTDEPEPDEFLIAQQLFESRIC